MLTWPEDLTDLSLPEDSDSARLDTVACQLGSVLHSGLLTLFIGSGISTVVGLPMWNEFNAKVIENAPKLLRELFSQIWCDEIEDELPTPSDLRVPGADPLVILDKVEQACSRCETLAGTGTGNRKRYVGAAPSWHQLIRRALYASYEGTGKYRLEDMCNPELVALCNLLVGGRRGLVREIVTFNYDDLLESYLRFHGHPYDVITPLPNRLTPNYSTTFYHPHGYLPLQDSEAGESSFLVLSKQSYEQVSSGVQHHVKLWRDFVARMLCVRIGLFVGISGEDEIHRTYFHQALDTAGPSTASRPLAFAVLVGDKYLEPDEWLKKRIVPLEFRDATAVAEFLTLVCQKAAKLAQ